MSIPIGELSRRTGVKVPTIRYYEGAGLMPAPARTGGQQRRYSETEVTQLLFIRYARDLGFEIEAIRELLTISGETDHPSAEVDDIARRHLAEVERRIRQLVAMRQELQRTVEHASHGRAANCRVIVVLAEQGECTSEPEGVSEV